MMLASTFVYPSYHLVEPSLCRFWRVANPSAVIRQCGVSALGFSDGWRRRQPAWIGCGIIARCPSQPPEAEQAAEKGL